MAATGSFVVFANVNLDGCHYLASDLVAMREAELQTLFLVAPSISHSLTSIPISPLPHPQCSICIRGDKLGNPHRRKEQDYYKSFKSRFEVNIELELHLYFKRCYHKILKGLENTAAFTCSYFDSDWYKMNWNRLEQLMKRAY